jgi:hypothetical protein
VVGIGTAPQANRNGVSKNDQNFELFTSVDVRKAVVGKREGKGELERIKLRGKNCIKVNLKYCK